MAKVRKNPTEPKVSKERYSKGYSDYYNPESASKASDDKILEHLNSDFGSNGLGGKDPYIKGKNAAFREMAEKEAKKRKNIVKNNGKWIKVDGSSGADKKMSFKKTIRKIKKK